MSTNTKSAFDFLMRNVKAKVQQQQQQQPQQNQITKANDSNNDDIILIEEKKPKIINTTIDDNYTQVEHITCHIQQFDDNDRALLGNQNYNFTFKNTNEVDYKIVKEEFKLGAFTSLNKNNNDQDADDFEMKHVFNCEKIAGNINDAYLNEYFRKSSSTPFWINLYHKINKRNNLENENKKIIDLNQNQQNLVNNNDVQLRRSKRRKTDAQIIVDESLKENENNINKNKKNDKNENDESKNLLWTEKYQFTDETDIICNRSQLERLKQWLEQFKKIKEKPIKIKTNNKNSSNSSSNEDEDTFSNTESNDDDSDFNYDSDCSTSTTSSTSSVSKRYRFHNNAILLNGPYGSGKTSAVYCVAKQLNFKLFECNSSSLRCKSQIIQELIGVLSSHHVGSNKKFTKKLLHEQEKLKNSNENSDFMKKQKKLMKASRKNLNIDETKTNTIDTFFKQKQILTNNNENTPNPRKRRKSNQFLPNNQQQPMNNENNQNTNTNNTEAPKTEFSELHVLKDSLILFDDIDVVLKEDQGFWSVISFFIKNSKKPIILTCNDEHMLKKLDLNIEQIKFYKPSKESCVNYLKTILLCESKRCLNEEFYLNQLVEYNKCDLRHSLLQLQLNTIASDNQNNTEITSQPSIQNDTCDESSLNSLCKFIDNYLIIDFLNYNMQNLSAKRVSSINQDPLKFDSFVFKEGLVDEDAIPSLSSTATSVIDEKTNNLLNLNRKKFVNNLLNFILKHDIYKNNKNIDYYSNLSFYEPLRNKILYKFAFTNFKFTSNKTLYLDYAPYLKFICQIEQLKQESNLKRRFLHYLNTTSNIGLTKEDYALLAKDNKFTISYEDSSKTNVEISNNNNTNDLYDSCN